MDAFWALTAKEPDLQKRGLGIGMGIFWLSPLERYFLDPTLDQANVDSPLVAGRAGCQRAMARKKY
jgi:hypothetical protein